MQATLRRGLQFVAANGAAMALLYMLGVTLNLSGYTLESLRQDSEFTLFRGRATASVLNGSSTTVLVATSTPEQPRTDRLRMLEHEFELRAELESRWAVRPIAITRWQGRTALVLEDVPGEPLDRLLEAALTGGAQVLTRSMPWARRSIP